MAELIKFEKGEIIFSEGEFEQWMFKINSGKVAIYSNYGKVGQKLLNELTEGDLFGEMGVIEDSVRSATAVAVTNCVVKPIRADDIDSFISENPNDALMLMQVISSRMRKLTKEYVSACSAIAEYVKADEENIPKSDELIERMKRIAEIGKKNKK